MDLVTNVVRGSESDRLLLLLHGYGADERDLGGLLQLPRSRGAFRGGDAPRPDAPPRRGSRGSTSRRRPRGAAAGFAEALAAIDELLDAACAEHGLPASRRWWVASRRAPGWRWRLALGGRASVPPRRRARDEPVRAAGLLEIDLEAARGVAVLLQHGTDDPMVPVARHPRAGAALARRRRPDGVPRIPDGPRGRARERAGRAGVAGGGASRRAAREPIPEPLPRGSCRR